MLRTRLTMTMAAINASTPMLVGMPLLLIARKMTSIAVPVRRLKTNKAPASR